MFEYSKKNIYYNLYKTSIGGRYIKLKMKYLGEKHDIYVQNFTCICINVTFNFKGPFF